jgi:hypothetical protein
MEIRDKLNTIEGYLEIIHKNEEYRASDLKRIAERFEDENNGIQNYPKPNLEIIESIKNSMPDKYFKILLASYSLGRPISDFKNLYLESIPPLVKVWKKSNGYEKMLQMIAIGILLEVEDQVFRKLSDSVKKDNPQDFILDLLINYRDSSWERSPDVTWTKPYKILKDIVHIAELDKNKSLELLIKYLEKDWYRAIETKTHDSKWNIHYGYWSFESGALVKVLGLDDSSLKGQRYYPYELVHYKD